MLKAINVKNRGQYDPSHPPPEGRTMRSKWLFYSPTQVLERRLPPARYEINALNPSTGKSKTVYLLKDDVVDMLKRFPEYKIRELTGDPATHKHSCVAEV